MLNKYNASHKYARALFDAAIEENELQAIQKEVQQLQQIFVDVPELGEALTDIRLDFKQKQIIFDELIEKASPMMSTFMQIVFENKRMDIMPAILENFNVRVDALSGIVKGKITSAVVLTKEQKETIEKQVANKFSIATIQLEEKVDETIVGGVIVEAQGKIIDGSVKTQLTKLRMLLSK